MHFFQLDSQRAGRVIVLRVMGDDGRDWSCDKSVVRLCLCGRKCFFFFF